MSESRQHDKLPAPASAPLPFPFTPLAAAAAQVPAGQLAVVTVSHSVTVNRGNYESGKCQLTVSLPCAIADIPEAHAAVQQFIQQQLSAEERRLREPAGVAPPSVQPPPFTNWRGHEEII